MGKILATKIRSIRQSLGMTQAQFADRLETTQSTVTRWEKGSVPSGEFLAKIADLANTTVQRLVGAGDLAATPSGQVPVVGYVGGGAAVIPFNDYANGDGMDHIERPHGIKGAAVAVEVQGDSLFPVAEDGWRLVYTDEHTIDEDQVINKVCVVALEDGRVLVKRLMRGSKPQHYHLVSTNAPIIEDQRILWAAKVKAIIPN